MHEGPESQTYTRLRRDALAQRAANEPEPPADSGRKQLVLVVVIAIAALAIAAKLSGLF